LSTQHQVIDSEWMKEAYRLTRQDAATGVDGMTAADNAQNLEANLLGPLERIKSGGDQAYTRGGGWCQERPLNCYKPSTIGKYLIPLQDTH
jgi:hypothetical protein